jgi:uncharacterized glyoxalase superfamily protein PhnB
MPTHIYPSLSYRDASAAVKFLERAFGFELVTSHEGPAGEIRHAEMRWGNSMIMFGQEDEDSIARVGNHAGQGWNYVSVDDADAHHDRARKAGAEITMELTDTDYGSRDYQAVDPEGNLWNFGTYDPLGA